MEKFKGKYRIPSARWTSWDYSQNAAYFITICAAHREHYFGEVVNGAMTVTPLGQAAFDCWQEIPAHFPFVILDEFVVMPNHVHGIIVIDKSPTAVMAVETQDFASLRQQQCEKIVLPPSCHGHLGAIVHKRRTVHLFSELPHKIDIHDMRLVGAEKGGAGQYIFHFLEIARHQAALPVGEIHKRIIAATLQSGNFICLRKNAARTYG